MSKLANSVNSCLSKMKEVGGVGKGTYGEEAVFRICEEIYQKHGGILYHSYTYKTDSAKQGNIKRSEQDVLYVENLSGKTEVDVLLVTKHRIFPIEVKAYKAKEIVLTNRDISGCFKTDKSPVHQNEMHCRHLYPAILQAVPEGKTAYIVPIVVFVDSATIRDRRTQVQKNYIKVTVLKELLKEINRLNTPLDYAIDLQMMGRLLKEVCTSSERFLPVREVSRGNLVSSVDNSDESVVSGQSIFAAIWNALTKSKK